MFFNKEAVSPRALSRSAKVGSFDLSSKTLTVTICPLLCNNVRWFLGMRVASDELIRLTRLTARRSAASAPAIG